MCGCVRLHTTSNTFLVTIDTPPGIASTLQEYQSWTLEMQNTDYSMIPISYVAPVSPIGSPTIVYNTKHISTIVNVGMYLGDMAKGAFSPFLKWFCPSP